MKILVFNSVNPFKIANTLLSLYFYVRWVKSIVPESAALKEADINLKLSLCEAKQNNERAPSVQLHLIF
jgi:uncharacterized membrane protein